MTTSAVDHQPRPNGVVAGLGCRRACPAEEIVGIVRAAERLAACQVGALAAPAFRQDEPGLHQAARDLGLGLSFVAQAALLAVQPLCRTRSAVALHHTGAASVAEGCALVASGGHLVLARIATARATCALAAP